MARARRARRSRASCAARTTVDFSGDFPVLSVQLPAGSRPASMPSQVLVTGSVFRTPTPKSEIDQLQLTGHYEFGEASRLDFGVERHRGQQPHRYSPTCSAIPGAASASPADYPDDVWIADNMATVFRQYRRQQQPGLFNQFFTFDFETRAAAARPPRPATSRVPGVRCVHARSRTSRSRRAPFVQWTAPPSTARCRCTWRPACATSRPTSSRRALVPVATGITWSLGQRINLTRRRSRPSRTLKGDYDYVLPNLDLSVDLSDNVILRGSYGKSIGRPGWGDIQGGQTLNRMSASMAAPAHQGNPGLEPLLSQNFDVSLRVVLRRRRAMLSAGYFRKNIDNYIGFVELPGHAVQPASPRSAASIWNEAIANGCNSQDVVCIRDYIFANHRRRPGRRPDRRGQRPIDRQDPGAHRSARELPHHHAGQPASRRRSTAGSSTSSTCSAIAVSASSPTTRSSIRAWSTTTSTSVRSSRWKA